MRKKTTVTRTLPCRLTDAELMERANRLASLFQADKEMSIRHKREKQRMKDEAEESSAAVNEVMKQVREKAEDRPVSVEVILDDEGGFVYFVRTDTGEVVEHRQMEDHERQLDMTDDEAQDAFVEAIQRFQERREEREKRAKESEDEEKEGEAKKAKGKAKPAKKVDDPEDPKPAKDLP